MDEDISSDDDRDQTSSSMMTKPEIKIGDEFLKILHDNSFNGMNRSNITEHIGKVLEITEWVKIPNVDKDELRLHVFSKSLSEDSKKWWDNEGTATTWKELDLVITGSINTVVTSSPSSGTISKHFLSFSDSLSSSNFCFLEVSYSSSSPALFKLLLCAISASAFLELPSTSSVM
ncbi:hypothetical protein Tco_0529801 [Tanacetum coccineum]